MSAHDVDSKNNGYEDTLLKSGEEHDESNELNSKPKRINETTPKVKKYFFSIGKTLLPFVIIFVIMEIIMVIVHAVNPTISDDLYPIPHNIIVTAWNAFFPGQDSLVPSVAIHIGWSFARVLLGFAIGVTAGIFVGILMGLSKWLYRFLNPLFSLMISIPTLAWVPILLTIFGLNTTTIIITIILGCFFPIVYNTTNGIRSIDKKLIWVAKIMGASRFDIFFDVLLPGSLVSLIAGIRLAIGYSWRAIIGAELLVALTDVRGIGYYIAGGKSASQVTQIMVGVFLIALGGLLLDTVLMKPLERFTIKRWGMIEESKTR